MKTQEAEHPAPQRGDSLGGRLRWRLRRWGLLPQPQAILLPLENAVESALRPVEPPAHFRARLRNDLAFAVRRRVTGLVVEYPKPLRESIILGLAAGALAMIIAVLVLIFRSRLVGAGR